MKYQRKAKHIRQKQQEKRFAQWFAAGGVASVLLAIGALLFWHSNQKPPEPIKIYKDTPGTPVTQRKSDSPAGTQQKSESVSHVHHLDDGHPHENVAPNIIETAPVDAASNDEISQDLEVIDADPTELEHAALHATLERVRKEFENLLLEIKEKYPEAIEMLSISHKELHKRYPTQASRDALNERLDQMRTDFKDRAIQLLSELPPNIQLEYIIQIDEQISKTHGDEAANQMTAELLSKLKL